MTQNDWCPHLSRQKGLILQFWGSETWDAVTEAFEFAISQFRKQFGPLHDTTLCTRPEYALFARKIGNRDLATNIHKDILAALGS